MSSAATSILLILDANSVRAEHESQIENHHELALIVFEHFFTSCVQLHFINSITPDHTAAVNNGNSLIYY